MKRDIDWKNLIFEYYPVDYRFVADYKDGKWNDGELTKDSTVHINECAGVLQYAQAVFEGMKVFRNEDGKVVAFRPKENGKRLIMSARRLAIPEVPLELFLKAMNEAVKANEDFIPPYGTGAALYLRPYIYGTSPVVGVKPAKEYSFRMVPMPVGPYYKEGIKPVSVKISDYDRAAPRGTGGMKAALNYAMSMYPWKIAHDEGFSENIYLDAKTRTKIEEAGGMNVIFVDKDGGLVVPMSDSILPSITRRSLVELARDVLGIKVQEREVFLKEINEFSECGLVGTAAVICPVGRIYTDSGYINFRSGMEEMGPVLRRLYDALTAIQTGKAEDTKGWLYEIKL